MSTTTSHTVPAPGELASPLSRRGVLFAAIWLFFLVEPLRVGWAHRDSLEGVLGILATVAFGAAYLLSWQQLRRGRAQLLVRPPTGIALAWFVALVALGVLMVVTLGQVGTTSSVYIAVTSVMLLRARVALVMVLANAAVVVVLGETVPGWDSGVGLAFSVCAASVAIFGIQQMMLRNLALVSAQSENAELAVENERTRFARDLHDILGHSLTVITVKAELAQRLLDVDTERTRAELADLERLSRDALSDVRRAVEGYRELTLPGELSRARTALTAAGIDARLPSASDDVPTELRELFAWAVREGVTNVLRHSQARTCTIELGSRRVEVRDDGRGIVGSGTGSGLLGLTERAAAVGATVSARDLHPGFSLVVSRE
jgi:two-component system, NarL family, sensor histidine kinase DesK